MKQERILFIGGPGNISASTIHELLDLGYDIAVLKRSKHIESDLIDKITVYYGDRNHKADVASTLEHYQPNTVVDCRCFDQRQAEDILDLIEGKGVSNLISSARRRAALAGSPLIPFSPVYSTMASSTEKRLTTGENWRRWSIRARDAVS